MYAPQQPWNEHYWREYATTGRFYVDYTRKPDGATMIERYQVSPSDPNVADKLI